VLRVTIEPWPGERESGGRTIATIERSRSSLLVRERFSRNLAGSACPLVEDDPQPKDCAYARDLQDFLERQR
jgi:hypothetical protein